jgi:acetamidase/formamidase
MPMDCKSFTRRLGTRRLKSVILLVLIALVCLPAIAQAQARAQAPAQAQGQGRGRMNADHYLPSKPENVTWGWFPLDKAPVVTVKSGETVRIDTISHHGATQAEDPVTFLAQLGVKPEEILQDARDFWATRASRSRQGRTGAHILTGPVAVTGAEPGDTLEIQILELSTRVPWGINTASATSGPFGNGYPGTKPGDPGPAIPAGTDARNLIRTAVVNGREVALFSDKIHVPLAPFMGTMAVAPANPQVGDVGVTVAGVQSSGPPGPYGGNMDVKALVAGTSLFLPVFQPGALFYTGDSHGVQGDGEVSGNALEQSLTGVFRFVLHKGMTITAPRAETPTHYIVMGIDPDLNRAMRMATLEAVNFLVKEKGMTPQKAFSLASLAVDFRVSEAVDDRQNVSGYIPKSLFTGN